MLPSLSMTAMCVVSFDTPAESCPSDGRTNGSDAARAVVSPARTSAFQYGHSFTWESNRNGSPATNAVDARVRIDERRALLRVGLRKEPFGGHLHERRIRVVRIAVRVCELHRLNNRVEVVGARMAHRVEIELLQDIERLQQHGTLTAEPVLVDGVAAIGRPRRLLDPSEVLGEVAFVERRVVLAQERDHLAGDVPFVKAITRRDDAGGASASFRAALGFDHASQRSGGGRQLDGLTRLVERAVGLEPVRLVPRPAFEELELVLNRACRARPHGKAAAPRSRSPGPPHLRSSSCPIARAP